MKLLTVEEIKDLSFPDTDITEFKILSDAFEIVGDSAHFSSPKKLFYYFKLKVIGESFRVMNFEKRSGKSLSMAEAPLKDICEFIYEDNRLMMNGFSAIDGHWTEIMISSPVCLLEVR